MSKLGFQFAPFDVDILDHERVLEACAGGDVTPFAIWAWTVIYVTKKRTRGSVSRAVINSALGGGDFSEAVAKLVRTGLFIEMPDGRIKVHNSEKKLPKLAEDGRTQAAKRQADYMARKKAYASSNQPDTDARVSVTSDVSTDVIPSILSPLRSSGSLEVLEEPSSGPRVVAPDERPSRPHNDAPVCAAPTSLIDLDDGLVRSDLPLLDDARGKYETFTSRNHLDTSVEDCWDGFVGNYATQRFGGRDGILGKFQLWLVRQRKIDDKARAERREREDRNASRDKSFAERFAKPDAVSPMSPYAPAKDKPEPSVDEQAAARRAAQERLRTGVTEMFPVIAPANDRTGTDE